MRPTPTWRTSAGDPPLVIAHRGLREGVEENTLEAFARAREAGADGIELDVRLAADGEPVVFHDADLGRLAGRSERVRALSSRELAGVALARPGQISRLAEVLAATRDLLVNVEIKSPRLERRALISTEAVALVDAVVSAIDADLGAQRRGDLRVPSDLRVLISSFDPFALARLRRRRPRWPVALLFHHKQIAPLRRAAPAALLRPMALHPDEALASPSAVANWRRRGFRVHPWTVNDPDRARALAAAGATALITDDPRAVRAALR
jgi:glycerophosphoryl diester phosphodiesterase